MEGLEVRLSIRVEVLAADVAEVSVSVVEVSVVSVGEAEVSVLEARPQAERLVVAEGLRTAAEKTEDDDEIPVGGVARPAPRRSSQNRRLPIPHNVPRNSVPSHRQGV